MFGTKRRNIAPRATLDNGLWTIRFIPGGYYHVRFVDGAPEFLTGAKKQPASEKMRAKLLPKALAAIDAENHARTTR